MIGIWIALGVVGGLLLLFGLWLALSYNSFVKLKNEAEESFSAMDVCMKKRYDLVPNIVETVKGYAKHEKETLERVIKARNAAVSAGSDEEKAAADNVLTGALKSIFALAENYPDLKANTNFVDLQRQLTNLETEIANSRRFYNATVKNFNTKVESFPSNLVAKMFKFKKRTLFEVDNTEERKAVKVEF